VINLTVLGFLATSDLKQKAQIMQQNAAMARDQIIRIK
jgi:hypothetical protein